MMHDLCMCVGRMLMLEGGGNMLKYWEGAKWLLFLYLDEEQYTCVGGIDQEGQASKAGDSVYSYQRNNHRKRREKGTIFHRLHQNLKRNTISLWWKLVHSPPPLFPLKLVPPADNKPSQQSSKQAASPSEQPANKEPSQRSSKPAAGPNIHNRGPSEQPVDGEPSQQSSRQEATPCEQPANQKPSQRSSKKAANPNEQPVDGEPSQQSSEQQPLQIPKASKELYLEPHTLDLTIGPEETVDDLNSSSSDWSDVIVCSCDPLWEKGSLGIFFHFVIIAKMCGRLLFFTFLFFGLLENVDFWLHSDMLCS